MRPWLIGNLPHVIRVTGADIHAQEERRFRGYAYDDHNLSGWSIVDRESTARIGSDFTLHSLNIDLGIGDGVALCIHDDPLNGR